MGGTDGKRKNNSVRQDASTTESEMSTTMTLDLSSVESDDEELMADLQALIESVTMAPPPTPSVLTHVTTTTPPVVATSGHSGQ